MQLPDSVIKFLLLLTCRILVLWPCHRIESRCPYVCGMYLPVCYRCLGIILGIAVGCILFVLINITVKWIGAVFVVPLFVDVTMQYHFNHESNNYRRCVTGLFFGIGASIYIAVWCRYNFL